MTAARTSQRVLQTAAGFFVAVGLSVAFAGASPLFDIYNNQQAHALLGLARIPDHLQPLLRFTYGMLGGTIAGKWVLAWFVVRHGEPERNPWAYRTLLWGLWVWFAVDSAASMWRGALFNVLMINLAPLVLFGVPLMRMGRTPAQTVQSPPLFSADRTARWVQVLSALVAVAGFALAVAPREVSPRVWLAQTALALFGQPTWPADAVVHLRFVCGPLGGTLCGFAVMAFMMARHAYFTPWVHRALLTGTVVWFVADSSMGMVQGAWFNVVAVNVPYLVAMVVPLAWTWRRAHGRA